MSSRYESHAFQCFSMWFGSINGSMPHISRNKRFMQLVFVTYRERTPRTESCGFVCMSALTERPLWHITRTLWTPIWYVWKAMQDTLYTWRYLVCGLQQYITGRKDYEMQDAGGAPALGGWGLVSLWNGKFAHTLYKFGRTPPQFTKKFKPWHQAKFMSQFGIIYLEPGHNCLQYKTFSFG